jgi:NAD+ diphosphatase
MSCPSCKQVYYPRLSPSIIVLVTRGDELLLARNARARGNFYSTLAGFVEPGESIEQAVHREVLEEVGVTVKNLEYFGSQPWPFPNSLMIAFTCSYVGGEIRLEEEELEDAGWYTADDLPRVPPKLSIARQMIDYFVAKHS